MSVGRYFVQRRRKAKASWLDDDPPLLASLEVSDHEPVDTGLVDKRGDPIMRAPRPIGFGRDHEW